MRWIAVVILMVAAFLISALNLDTPQERSNHLSKSYQALTIHRELEFSNGELDFRLPGESHAYRVALQDDQSKYPHNLCVVWEGRSTRDDIVMNLTEWHGYPREWVWVQGTPYLLVKEVRSRGSGVNKVFISCFRLKHGKVEAQWSIPGHGYISGWGGTDIDFESKISHIKGSKTERLKWEIKIIENEVEVRKYASEFSLDDQGSTFIEDDQVYIKAMKNLGYEMKDQ